MHAIRRLLTTALDIILPKQSGELLVAACTEVQLREKCDVREIRGIRTLFRYQDPLIKQLIWALKYRGDEHAAMLFASALAEVLLEEAGELHLFAPNNLLFVPIPLSDARKRERGHNQMELVLEKLAPLLGVGEYHPDVLRRARDTKAQTTLSKEARHENVRDAFCTTNPERVHSAHVFLFDDVTTTGATLREAAKVLREAGAIVYPIALAH